ncbi:hypothetical protein B0T26DRAFT_753496 [Lasiosphaeria miniovina]|uniref:Heterokaryon incompatibility domain-containing protein n=1 Tax=Lasiosphaeria miniovina TaxID=1954250 RepID=A0AA40ACX0_9PEZI|nr:uncharacterized protein B0T26DRAFT_753496 [Lasiosphaeria miniovina]KAK0713383.1 hypothetical protein B0T26DRAFT_753496 [Lasiosphaeria miniovina]
MAASAAQNPDMAPARPIRIVDLSQSRESHFLRLMNVSFFEVLPQYLALSYCWGGYQAPKCARSNRMSLEQEIPFADLPLTLRDAVRVAVQLDIPPEPIDARGWTLQERLLSPRTIEYGTWQTRYICQESAYKRDYTDGWRRDADYNHQHKDTLDLEPLLHWDQVLRTYTSRQLTRSTDRPLAISGIAERFASILNIDGVGSCYVAGLWKPFLYYGSMWHIDRDAIAPRPVEFQAPASSFGVAGGAAGRNTRNAASVMVLEVQHYTAGASWGCCGRVLRRAKCTPSDNPFEGSVFRRVGTFEYATHREGQRTGESWDEWERRIETDFSWFKNTEPREIEIL